MGHENSCCANKRQSLQPIDSESHLNNQNQVKASRDRKWHNNKSSAQEIKKTKSVGNPKLSQSHYNAQHNLKRKKLGNFNTKVSSKRNFYGASKKQKKYNSAAEKQRSKKDMLSTKVVNSSFCTPVKTESSKMKSSPNNSFYMSCKTQNYSRKTSMMSTDIIYEEMAEEFEKMKERYSYKKCSPSTKLPKRASTMYTKIDGKKAICCNNAIVKNFKLI
ncbi:unnamed protein product [Moneuplotes crassus]|uniref:Uncharacterized protein n=1 Tax=Euplotes crassus TaxID=5936 RepID=A0AAD1Y6M2_EUPCR|nr:unnamed protein product [Moneuplotes crassus]